MWDGKNRNYMGVHSVCLQLSLKGAVCTSWIYMGLRPCCLSSNSQDSFPCSDESVAESYASLVSFFNISVFRFNPSRDSEAVIHF